VEVLKIVSIPLFLELRSPLEEPKAFLAGSLYNQNKKTPVSTPGFSRELDEADQKSR
jgi:hypothetical protein